MICSFTFRVLHSPKSSLPTAWWLSTWPRISGTSCPVSPPRLPVSPSLRYIISLTRQIVIHFSHILYLGHRMRCWVWWSTLRYLRRRRGLLPRFRRCLHPHHLRVPWTPRRIQTSIRHGLHQDQGKHWPQGKHNNPFFNDNEVQTSYLFLGTR